MPSDEDRCSLRSLAAHEPLVGTASTIRHWLLVESEGPWGRDGLRDARLPAGLGDELRALERRTDARVLLIRKPDRRPARDDGRRSCVAVDTRDGWLGSRPLDRIEEATRLDPRDRSAFEPASDPVFVVCTHGRRDPCCAEQGRPLSERLGATSRDVAWESTHVGGDRFAANLVAFPHGLYFGRVEPDEGPTLVDAYADGRIAPLGRYRGRACHRRHVQAAERDLRADLGIDRIDAIRPLRASRRGDEADVVFSTPRGDVRVRLERSPGTPLRLTCHADAEETPAVWRTGAIELTEATG
ncbi:MAG TPA: sucrase ferredoxin [Actinomycetota bacterium]|nr:sucrase ferredoxin [Actinomycetota bacterium]